MKYKINKDVLWRDIDGEVVIVNIDTNENCYLNKTGSEVWQMVNKGLDIENIYGELSKAYVAKIDDIKDDINNIIKDLVKSKILLRAD